MNRLLGTFLLLLCLAAPAFAQTPTTLSGPTNGNPPAASVGAEGNMFIDTSTGQIYGPKSFGVWPSSPSQTPNQPGYNIVYSGPGGPPNVWQSVYGKTLSGNLSSPDATGTTAPLQYYIGNDTVTGIGLAAMDVLDGVGAGFAGGRIGIQGKVVVNGVPSTTPSSGLTGVTGSMRLNANLLGTTGAYTNYLGTAFGGNSQVIATNNATFASIVNGHEFDVELQTGGSAAEKHAATFVATANDAVQATYDDSAIEIADQNQSAFVGWNLGISFGGYAHLWPFNSSSTLIGIQNRVVPSAGTSPANIGVDMSNGTFTTAQYKGTNFLVDGSGNTFVGRTSVLTIGDSLSVFKSNNGPGGMTVDNNNGGTATYTMINLGNGNATTEAQIRLNGSSFSGGIGANGLSIGITAAGATLELGTGSEVLRTGSSGMFTANGTVATAMSSLGPAGSHATIQEWFTVTDASGNVRYIPAF